MTTVSYLYKLQVILFYHFKKKLYDTSEYQIYIRFHLLHTPMFFFLSVLYCKNKKDTLKYAFFFTVYELFLCRM